MSENIHRAGFCCESLGRDGLVLTSHSSSGMWPLLTSQTHPWRRDGTSALVPNFHSLPMADIANRSQYSSSTELAGMQTLAAKWKQQVSWRAEGWSPKEPWDLLWTFPPAFPTHALFACGTWGSWKTIQRMETHRMSGIFFSSVPHGVGNGLWGAI